MRASELRPSVKSGLMIGAAGAAVTFGATGAFGDSTSTPPPSIHKYLPYTQIGGTSGDSMSTGDVTLFIPAWQALNQLLFIKVGGDLASGEGNFSTFGVGYRQKIAPRWIVGAFGNYDHTHTKLNDDFTQFVFGAELLNPDWEFHGNAYVADTSKIDLIKNSAQLEVDGNDIAIVREQEAPYSGFDGSGGYRAFKTPGTDGRLYAGGFYFKPSEDFDTKPIAGPKAGFEFNVYDLDFIGPQSRLQIQGEGRHDDVRGYTGFVGINLRVPLNIDPSGGGAQVLDELDRRMVDDPQTQGNVLTHSEFNKPEPVIIYGGSGGRTHPTNTIFYVDNSTGAGSYPNPTTFSDATTRGGDDALIVITTKEGDVSGQGVLAPGDMVIGAGTTLTIRGAETGYKFTHTFAPGEHDSVLNVPAGQTAITLASDNALYNFAIQGSFGTAIAGDNVGTATIRNLAITGDGSEGQKGIALTQDGPSALDLLMTDTSVSGVGSDGISLATHLDGAETHNSKIEFDNVSVSNAGGNGITFSTEASGGAAITQDITLNNVSVSGAGNIGIGIAGFAEGGGSQLTQTATITDANVTNVAGTGIAIYGYTSGGGALAQNVNIDPTIVTGSGYALGIGAYANGGTLNQTVNVDTLSGNGDNNGVEIYAYASGGATLNQTATLSNIGFDAVGHDGVRLFAHSYGGAYINQGVEFDGLTLNGAGLYDIAVEAYADGGAVRQTALFNNVTINGAAQTAVDIFAETGNGGEGSFRPLPSGGENGNYYSLIQDVVFNTAAINTNGNGFYAGAKSSNGDSAAQYVSFSSDSTITAYDGGVTIYANASGNSLIHQQVHLPQVTLNGSIGGEGGEGGFEYAMGGGIRIETHSSGGSTVDSYTLIDSASITYAADAAVSLAAYAQGGNIDQTLKLNNANISSYYATGISIYGDADGATLNQNAFFNNVTINGSGDPFTATAKGLDGGTINQYVSFTGDSALNSIDGSVSGSVVAGKYGIANQTLLFPNIDAHAPFGEDVSLTAEAYYGATAHQGVSFSTISSSHSAFGLAVDGAAFANGSLTQNITANNIVATYENGDGIELEGLAASGAHLSQYLTINAATLTDDSGSGVYALLSELNGANALQMISLGNADTNGGGIGIKLHASTLNGGTAEQDAALNNISAQYETFSGIALYANSSGNTIQRADINGLTANHDRYDGVRIKANIDSGTLGQYVSIADATLTYDNNGVNIYASGYGGTAHQQATLSDLTVNAGNSGAGVLLGAHGDTGADLYQAVTATNSHFDNNGVGIAANNHLVGGASLHQGIGLYSSSADYNSSGGISIYTYASGATAVYNNLVVHSADVSHNNGIGGIYVDMASSNSDIVTQNANIQNSTIDNNNGYGVRLRSGGFFNGSSYQSLVSASDDISGNGVNGIFEAAQNVGVLQQI
ncbi:MAG TPA: inverse autotransporter beta domain-containing protein, partial [Rhizomicrobium sp.]